MSAWEQWSSGWPPVSSSPSWTHRSRPRCRGGGGRGSCCSLPSRWRRWRPHAAPRPERTQSSADRWCAGRYRPHMPIDPDTKNWTWVLERPCNDCGFDAATVEVTDLGDLIRANAAEWPALLAHEHARLRPTDDQWSALEYA